MYPEGNCIACSPETPYLQIGELKYGKPILDRVIRGETSLEDAARCALVSPDSTMPAPYPSARSIICFTAAVALIAVS